MATTIQIDNGESGLDLIVFDASPSQTHERSSSSTSFPVENGSDISDHIINNPETLSIKGFFSAIIKSDGEDQYPHITSFQKLDKARREGKLVSVDTSIEFYENMSIQKLSVPIEVQTGDSFYISVELKKFNFAYAKTSKVPKAKLGKANGTNKNSKASKKTKDKFSKKQKKGLKSNTTASGSNLSKAQNTAKAAVKPGAAVAKTKSWAASDVDSLRKSFGF